MKSVTTRFGIHKDLNQQNSGPQTLGNNDEDKRIRNKVSSSQWRGWLFPWASLLYLAVIWGGPTALTLSMLRGTAHVKTMAFIAPIIWSVAFVMLAGMLSIPHQFAVVPGKFRRCVNDRRYFHRRLYGLCWTAVYYNKPVYFLCLSMPPFKWLTFRLFGYKGSMDFTIYPDTWIRDLPLLHFEDGAYVSNRATLGTNIVLNNGLRHFQPGCTVRSPC